MQNQNLHNDYSDLIFSYLSGNASDAEVAELESWVLAAPENKEKFMAYKKAWMLSGMQQKGETINVDQLWKETSAQLFQEGRVVDMGQKRNRRNWLAIAAAIAVLIVAGLWMFKMDGEVSPMIVHANDEVKSVDLPDGSQVTLNQSSSLTYALSENGETRNVMLKGDAFFEVARDERHSFVIKAQDVEVEVLGTSFYVDNRDKQDEIQVIVKSGSVAVRAGNSDVILKADEKAVFKKATGDLIKEQNQDPNFTSITSDTLVFNQTRLAEVVFTLNRHFNANISIGNDLLKDCELTATFRDKSLDAILIIIEGTLTGLKIEQSGSMILLNGTDCD